MRGHYWPQHLQHLTLNWIPFDSIGFPFRNTWLWSNTCKAASAQESSEERNSGNCSPHGWRISHEPQVFISKLKLLTSVDLNGPSVLKARWKNRKSYSALWISKLSSNHLNFCVNVNIQISFEIHRHKRRYRAFYMVKNLIFAKKQHEKLQIEF